MKKDEISQEAMDRARKAIERMKNYSPEFFKDLENMPEPKCDICGRVIYCGVNSLCREEPCGLKR